MHCVKLLAFAIAIALAYAVPNCRAAEKAAHPTHSGTFWFAMCSQKDGEGASACAANILAVDAVNDLLTEPLYCSPPGSSIGLLNAVTFEYMKKHPNELDADFGRIVVRALSAFAPCVK